MRKLAKQLAEYLDEVRRGEEIEAIHRARVASRRLRAVLGTFRDCWKKKLVKPWKRQIRQLARNLGEARDQDVLMEYLTAQLAASSDPALLPGIACMLSHVEQDRRWLQPRVLKAVDRFERNSVLETMQAAANTLLKAVGKDQPAPGGRGGGRLAKGVSKRRKELWQEAPGLAAPEDQERHHAMRIAAKRLRYTLELARPAYPGDGGELTEAAEAAKRLQSLLGEIHDCDVWTETFAEFSRQEANEIQRQFGNLQRFERIRGGLEHLRQDRSERRSEVFAELVAYWQELKEKGLWDRLAIVMEWGGDKSPQTSQCGDTRHGAPEYPLAGRRREGK